MAAGPINLGLANGLQMLLQRDDGWRDLTRLYAPGEPIQLLFDDLLRAFGLAAAAGQISRHHRLQVIDVINENAVEPTHARIHVARDGDIDEEHGTVLPPL